MKYFVKAKLIPEMEIDLHKNIENETLGMGSVAFGEYVKNMKSARVYADGTICWIEVCFCDIPLKEERPYWEKYFTDIIIENALEPSQCKDFSGETKKFCLECECTISLEKELSQSGKPFIK